MHKVMDRIRFITPDESSIECCKCRRDIEAGNLINEFEHRRGEFDVYCMDCLKQEASKDCVWSISRKDSHEDN